MTPDQYIQSIMAKYAVQTGPLSPAERAANAIAPAIRNWSGQWLLGISYSGSYAKGTAVATGTDLDLFISLSSKTPGSLKDIYMSLYRKAVSSFWSPVMQNVSIGLKHSGRKIDLVPARLQSGYKNVHSLYHRKTDTWRQTDVAIQIRTVSGSKRVNEIRALKIWRDLHQLEFPSFFLELATIEGLKYQRFGNLANNVIHALRYFGSSLTTTRIVDPGNTNNVISDDLTLSKKFTIQNQANSSANAQNWSQIIW